MTKEQLMKDAEKSALKWRLATKPTREDVVTLLDKGVINKDEARDMLFSEDKPMSANEKIKALEEQVKFLQDVIDKLASQPPQIVTKYIHDYTPRHSWLNTVYSSPVVLTGSLTGNLLKTAVGTGNTAYASMGATTLASGSANTIEG